MSGHDTTSTSFGDLHTVRRRRVPAYRVGYRPDPWSWTPWQYAGPDGQFNGRWDDPHCTFRTLYCGFSALACYLEILAAFRADPLLAEELGEIDDNDDSRNSTVPAGTVPRSWCTPRLIASGRLSGTFAVPGHPESLPTLRHRFLNDAKSFGLADLDAAAIRDSRPRALTQAISAWIYTLRADDASLSGIEFSSRHGDNLTLWALYERDTTITSPPEITAVSADAINGDDPDLNEALRLHRLTWSD